MVRRMIPTKALYVLGPFAAVVLYVAASGPAMVLYRNGFLPGDAVSVVYAPITWSCDHNKAVLSFFQWYISLFHPLMAAVP